MSVDEEQRHCRIWWGKRWNEVEKVNVASKYQHCTRLPILLIDPYTHKIFVLSHRVSLILHVGPSNPLQSTFFTTVVIYYFNPRDFQRAKHDGKWRAITR